MPDMFAWNDASRRWYLTAAAHSSYHTDLAAALAPWLAPSDHVVELGCGLGCLAIELGGLVRNVLALDIDPECLVLADAERARRGVGNVVFRTGDAFTLPARPVWDVAVTCLFGNLPENAAFFRSLARRYVLCVVDRGGKKMSIVPDAVRRYKIPADQIEASLRSQGLAYTRKDLDFEFGQPLTEREEAKAFIRHYSMRGMTEQDLDAFLDERLEIRNGMLCMPHTKKLTLFALPCGKRD